MVLKRKNSHIVCIEPKKTKDLPTRNMTKADLVKELKSIQKINETLEEEINCFKNENRQMNDTIKTLKEKAVKHNETQSTAVQTEKMLACQKCDYTVNDVYEFDAHRWSEHEEDEVEYNDFGDDQESGHTNLGQKSEKYTETFKCNICDENFPRKAELMRHKKREHNEHVATCWKYSLELCTFTEESCWFNHKKIEKCQLEIDCNWCEKVFKTQTDFRRHKKKEHKEFVSNCRNKEACTYNECWFIHNQKDNEKLLNENQEIVDKIFGMMEKMEKRLIDLENVM